MKYVIFNQVGRFRFIIFPESFTHAVVADGVIRAFSSEKELPLFVHSAGTCETGVGGHFEAYSGSYSLGIPHRKEADVFDSKVLNLPEAMQGMIL